MFRGGLFPYTKNDLFSTLNPSLKQLGVFGNFRRVLEFRFSDIRDFRPLGVTER